MRIAKDVETFLGDLNATSKVIKSLSQCSMNQQGVPMVDNQKSAYDFDTITKVLFNGDVPASVDCLYIYKKTIEFIEFKDGLIDKYNKTYISPDYTCDECIRLHKEVYENLKNYREAHKESINKNLQLKASESLLTFQNCILPQCSDSISEYRLRLVCVYKQGDIDPEDEYEIGLEDLAKAQKQDTHSEAGTSSNIQSILRKYGKEDKYKCHPFFEEIYVCSNLEFQALSRYR